MNLKSLSLTSMMVAAALGMTAEAEALRSFAMSEVSPGSPLSIRIAEANPGFRQVEKNQLSWTGTVSGRRSQKTEERKSPANNIVAGEMPTLMGSVCYADSWNITGVGKVGIYSIGPQSIEEVSLQPELLTTNGQVYAGAKYFATQPEIYGSWIVDMKYKIYDTRDWSSTTVAGDYNFDARAMAFDPLSRRAYAITRDDEYCYYFTVMDLESYDYTRINMVGVDDWSALMCDGMGAVYGIKKNGELVKFNRQTGEYTTIGQTGLQSAKMTCGTIDPATGRCFYVHYTGFSSDMYEIDLSSAAPTYLYAVPENAQILSLFVPEKEVPAAAPAKATALETDFEANSLSGNLCFSIPNTASDGSPMSDDVSYVVSIDGKAVAEGVGSPGDRIACPVEVPASGEYIFSVKLANKHGESEPVALTNRVGYPVPPAPKTVSLKVDGDVYAIAWEPVTVSGAQAGDITYSVKRFPGGVTVADGLTETEFKITVPSSDDLNRVSFGVTAVYGDSRSAEARSGVHVTGYLPLPFVEDFEDASCVDLFSIYDNNNDGRTWSYGFFADEGRLVIDYSLSQPHDDWVVFHPVKLEGGKLYTFTCHVRGTGSPYVEKFEVLAAKDGDVESLKNGEVVLPVRTVSEEYYNECSASFLPEESGVYYFAFHCLSDADQNKLFLDDVSISKGVATLAPAGVKGLGVIPDVKGNLSTTISFTAPTLGMDGKPLSDLSYISIERNGEEIGQVRCEPGAKASFIDESPENGENTYTVAGVNSYGRGSEISVTVYVGVFEPVPADDVTLRYGSNTGEAVVTWSAPKIDIFGHSIDPADLTYNVYVSVGGSVRRKMASGLTETSFIDQTLDADADQRFVCYYVEAVGVGGSSELAPSNLHALGRPEKAPLRESFGGRSTDFVWGASASDDSFTEWSVYPAVEFPAPTYDGGSIAAAAAEYLGYDNTATLTSGLIDLSGLEKPVLSFYLFDYVDSDNRLTVYVDNGREISEAGSVTFGERDMKWKKKSIDLSHYKGQTICLMLEAEIVDYAVIAIDNLRVAEDTDHNLAAITISAPESVEANKEFSVSSLIENAGKESASGYSVSLLVDGKVMDSVEGSTLTPEVTKLMTFKATLPVVCAEKPVVAVAIDYPLDEDDSDNISPEAIVKFIAPEYPAPENLAATVSDGEVALTWDAPDLTKMKLHTSTDDVESYVPFSTGLPSSVIADDDMGEWSVIDADGLNTYTNPFDYPGVGNPAAFVVYNAYMQEDNVFACHSGHQMFISMASRPKGDQGNDDWLISPELAGCAQTISFYAQSIVTYGPDQFQVLYSTGGKEIEDFKLLLDAESTGDWKQYSVDLPEGARYFAIRRISCGKHVFMLDDFKMIKASDVVKLEVEGYNVYCDGKRVNDSLIKETDFRHVPERKDSSYIYNVACVYNVGESGPSESVEVSLPSAGVDAVADGNVKVTGIDGLIIVEGLDSEIVTVADSFGRIVCRRHASGKIEIEVPAGIYVVSVGGVSAKVIVK